MPVRPLPRARRQARVALLAAVLAASLAAPAPAEPITYQGRLATEGAPATGTYDLAFTLWNASAGGGTESATLLVPAVSVTDGFISTELDFGPGAFTQGDRWLEVQVRATGEVDWTVLGGRVRVTPAPVAAHALGPWQSTPADITTDRLVGIGLAGPPAHPLEVGNAAGPYAIVGRSSAPDSFAVVGEATAGSGANTGVQGTASGPGSTGVAGVATAATGSSLGVYGLTNSADGSGVLARNTASGAEVFVAGGASAVDASIASPSGAALKGTNSGSSLGAAGVLGESLVSPGGTGVAGSGARHGVAGVGGEAGVLGASSAAGVLGRTTGTGEDAVGVLAESTTSAPALRAVGSVAAMEVEASSDSAVAVLGSATSPEGETRAGRFLTQSPEGTGVQVLVGPRLELSTPQGEPAGEIFLWDQDDPARDTASGVGVDVQIGMRGDGSAGVKAEIKQWIDNGNGTISAAPGPTRGELATPSHGVLGIAADGGQTFLSEPRKEGERAGVVGGGPVGVAGRSMRTGRVPELTNGVGVIGESDTSFGVGVRAIGASRGLEATGGSVGVLGEGGSTGGSFTGAIGITASGIPAGRFTSNGMAVAIADKGSSEPGEQYGVLTDGRILAFNEGRIPQEQGQAYLGGIETRTTEGIALITRVSPFGTNGNQPGGVGIMAFAPGTTQPAWNPTGVNKIPKAFAAYFRGKTVVEGDFIVKGTKNFVIDHPTDPTKYLVHAAVESNEVINLYSGNVILEANGEATVTMPEWFTALNKEIRYTLTPIGAPMPNLHVAQKMTDGENEFIISGGVPGGEVSWQLTGKRADFAGEQVVYTPELDRAENPIILDFDPNDPADSFAPFPELPVEP